MFSPLKWLEHQDCHLDYKVPEGTQGQRQHLVPVPKGLKEKYSTFYSGQVYIHREGKTIKESKI